MRTISLCLVLSGVAVSQITARPGPNATERELLAADSTWCANASGPASFVAPFAEDVWYIAPGHPVARGRKRALELMLADSALAGARLSWAPARVLVSHDGMLGATFGYVAVRGPGARSAAGKYIAAWRHSANGWEVAAWVFTPSPAGPQPAAPDDFGVRAPGWSGTSDGTDAARLAVMRTDAEFAGRSVSNGLGAAFTDFAAEDAAIMSAGEPAITWGRAAIAESNRSIPRSVLLTWAPVDGAAAASADLGFTVGQATIASAPPGARLRLGYSKYLTIWKRQPSGEWRYVVDGGNKVPAP